MQVGASIIFIEGVVQAGEELTSHGHVRGYANQSVGLPALFTLYQVTLTRRVKSTFRSSAIRSKPGLG